MDGNPRFWNLKKGSDFAEMRFFFFATEPSEFGGVDSNRKKKGVKVWRTAENYKIWDKISTWTYDGS